MGRLLLLFSMVMAMTLPMPLQADEAQSAEGPKEVSAAQYNTRSAKVIGIDKATHTLTLENDRGESRQLSVDPARVKNFDQIKVGDLVVVRETEQLALTLTKRQKGEKPEAGAALEMSKTPAGDKPGAEKITTAQISAEVVKVDQANQMIELKGPEGNIVSLKVRDPKRLEGVKKGDMVAATYTRAMAISVEPQPAK